MSKNNNNNNVEINKFQKNLDDSLNKRFYSTSSTTSSDETTTTTTKEYLKYKSLREFGYDFNDKLELRSIKGNEKFKFIDQDHYDRFGYFVVREIQNIMISNTQLYNMKELQIPLDETDPYKGNIFTSNDFETNNDTLVILICGSGQVKAGQWARSLCINDSLESGSILPYLEEFKKRGYSSIVLNPNNNYYQRPLELDDDDKSYPETPTTGKKVILGSDSPLRHALYCYDLIISGGSPAKNIIIIAHSYGGVITSDLIDKRPEILDKLKRVAFTDSVHSISKNTQEKTKKFFENPKKTMNWVRSDKELGSDLGFSKIQGCQIASSGHTVHEFTSSSCKSKLFEFIKLE